MSGNNALENEWESNLKIAVLIPCFNEEQTIASVIEGFRISVPSADIYVYDNNSTDKTSEKARQVGAIVRSETNQGKGYVVRRMFADIEADIYIMIDGDGTYEPAKAPELISTLVTGNYDMVTAVRDFKYCDTYKNTHLFGTTALGFIVNRIFKGHTSDIFSGYRVFSHRFVKSFPMISSGFEIETEMVIHATMLGIKTAELKSPYYERKAGSESKLRSLRDGFRIFNTIILLFKEERPLYLFSLLFVLLAVISIALGVPIVHTYITTGSVDRVSTAVLSSAFMLLAFFSLVTGIILSSVTTARREVKKLFYLSITTKK